LPPSFRRAEPMEKLQQKKKKKKKKKRLSTIRD
jgi:hypothetical protein